ncbi:hypothetical protein [Vibrio sp. SCSIO 43136]|uniref:hypothetical protein n=1 Tax=Vibrio sp. SCSIO 43136 TaxID=2819101 RepID=UPI002075B349|nr:hypothetical protein [Vibrio sp. SCSIO 43136]USD68136.1 hypothetical protein J4N39_18350 [Vibrio sp. SCSIO 43136]
MTDIPEPSTYCMLPGGTKFLFGAVDAEAAAMKQLKDAIAIGATGKQTNFTGCTRLLDKQEKSMAGLAPSPDKQFGFHDDVDDKDMQEFLDAAEAGETKKVRIEYPNKRYAEMIIVLGGWEHTEPDSNTPMGIVVYGKQNDIKRGKIPPPV